MKMRKILALLLVFAIAGSTLAFTSCNGGGGGRDDDYEVPEEDLSPTFDGDVKTFKGSFNVLTGQDGTATSSFNVVDLVADNNLGDAAIIKCVRERNERIEANFGIKIKRTKQGADHNGTLTAATNAVQGKSTTYDAFMLPVDKQMTLACGGGMLDLYTQTYIDITADWWDDQVVDNLLLCGGAYLAMGDLQTVDKDATYCVLFNEKLLEDYNKGLSAETLYAEVMQGVGKTGGLTMEDLNRYAQQHATPDLAGHPMYRPEYDGVGNYGLYTQTEMTRVILEAGGFSPTKVNKEELTGLEANINQEFEAAVLEVAKVFGEVSEDVWFCNLDKYQNESPTFWDTHMRGSFKANRATFLMCHLGNIENLRDMEADFGVLPIPKLYETQEEYSNSIQYYNCKSYSVPNRGETLNDKSCYILEAMSYYSSQEYAQDQSLNYNYYYRVLRAKGVRDENAWKMLDLIFDNRTYDLVFAAGIGGVADGISKATSSKGANAFQAKDYGGLNAHIKDKLATLIGE